MRFAGRLTTDGPALTYYIVSVTDVGDARRDSLVGLLDRELSSPGVAD